MLKKRILLSFTLLLCLLNVVCANSEEINTASLDRLLKQKWEGMKWALKHKDIEAALKYFIESAKPKHRQMFEALKEQLPTMMDTFVEFNITDIWENTAECEVVTKENGTLYSHPVSFVKDVDGVWKFRAF